jgi:hypothetical protein
MRQAQPIYVVDLRNGLCVLRSGDTLEREVERIGFVEGNSNEATHSAWSRWAAPLSRYG